MSAQVSDRYISPSPTSIETRNPPTYLVLRILMRADTCAPIQCRDQTLVPSCVHIGVHTSQVRAEWKLGTTPCLLYSHQTGEYSLIASQGVGFRQLRGLPKIILLRCRKPRAADRTQVTAVTGFSSGFSAPLRAVACVSAALMWASNRVQFAAWSALRQKLWLQECWADLAALLAGLH